jgi:Flp pilus assembly protein TadG
MANLSRTSESERGAILIHVAVALLGLVALTTFVTDYGIMWVSRGQAQTAADAGALSGAGALAWDSPTDFPGAQRKAQAVALANGVFGAAPDVQLTDVTFPACPPGSPGTPGTCVKVDVFRNLARGNPLPMFFGQIVGVSNQGVRATATAQVIPGNTTECLKPWAVIDRWDEYDTTTNGAESEYAANMADPDYNYNATYDKYSTGQGNAPPQENDLYVPPSGVNATNGTGFRLPTDRGRQYVIKTDTNSNSTISAGWFRAIRIPRLDGQVGGNVYRDNITTCGGLPTSYADPSVPCPTTITNQNMNYWAERGCFGTEPGNMVGPTSQGVNDLLALDPNAIWSNGGISGSTYPANSSPRIVPIGVIDIDNFLSQDPTGANGVLRLVNIFGFFIEGFGDVDANGNIIFPSNGGKAVVGRLMTLPGLVGGSTTVPAPSAFITTVILVR